MPASYVAYLGFSLGGIGWPRVLIWLAWPANEMKKSVNKTGVSKLASAAGGSAGVA